MRDTPYVCVVYLPGRPLRPCSHVDYMFCQLLSGGLEGESSSSEETSGFFRGVCDPITAARVSMDKSLHTMTITPHYPGVPGLGLGLGFASVE